MIRFARWHVRKSQLITKTGKKQDNVCRFELGQQLWRQFRIVGIKAHMCGINLQSQRLGSGGDHADRCIIEITIFSRLKGNQQPVSGFGLGAI